MTMPPPSRFDFGDRLHRRKASFARARELVEGSPTDSRYDRLRALVEEAVERLRAIPAPLVEHPDRLAMLADTERAAVAELHQLERQPGAASADPEPEVDLPPADAEPAVAS